MKRNELLIENYPLDTLENIEVAITKELADISKPGDRKSDYTKTVIIPGSKVNDFVFKAHFDVNYSVKNTNYTQSTTYINDGSLPPYINRYDWNITNSKQLSQGVTYNIEKVYDFSLFDGIGEFVSASVDVETTFSTPTFDPSKRARCKYLQDGITQIDGYCQLKAIHILNDNKVEYEIIIYGSLFSLFNDIKSVSDGSREKYLYDIQNGFGGAAGVGITEATYSDAEVIASWTNTNGPFQILTYPFVEIGRGVNGRVTPIGTDPINVTSYDINAFTPWIYVSHVFNSIITEAGYTIEESSWFYKPEFQNLIMSCDISNFVENAEAVNAYRVICDTLVSPLYFVPGSYYYTFPKGDIWFNNKIQDPNNDYSTFSGNHTIPKSGYYNFEITVDVELNFNVVYYNGTVALDLKVLKANGSGTKIIRSEIYRVLSTNPTQNATFTFTIDSKYLEIGDEVFLQFGDYKFQGNVKNSDIDYINLSPSGGNSRYEAYPDGRIEANQTFNIASILPNMSQYDFMTSIVKMFNLYIDIIPGTKGLIIEPRDDFFTDETLDYTSKLDTEKDFKILPLGLDKYKKYNYRHTLATDDTSKYKNTYYNNYIDTYKQIFEIPIFNASGQTFSSDTLDIPYPYTKKYDNWHDMQIITNNEFNKDETTLQTKFALLPDYYNKYNGSYLPQYPNVLIGYYNISSYSTISKRYWDNSTLTFTQYNIPYYSYSGIDENFNNINLTFKNTVIGYYLNEPNQFSLFDAYYKNEFLEITDADSKIIECYLKLNHYDIANLNFRKTYWINKTAYRLLSVNDFDPNNNETTLCKFVKINTGYIDTLSGIDYRIPDKTNTGDSGNGGGDGGSSGGMGEFVVTDGLLGINKNRIELGSVGVVITGVQNFVGQDCANINIQGSYNTVEAGCYNVTLINTDNVTITESNKLYIDGVEVKVDTPADGTVWTYNTATGIIEFITPNELGYVPYIGASADLDMSSNNIIVSGDPYSASWNGSNQVPTKNDIYNKIESLSTPTIIQRHLSTVNLTFTETTGVHHVFMDGSSNPNGDNVIVFELPPASSFIQITVVKKDSSFTDVRINPETGSGALVNGGAYYTILTALESRTFFSDGQDWYILQ